MSFLGIDIGTSATKALLLSSGGKILATAESPHTLLSPRAGWTEQNPDGPPGSWWPAVTKAVKKLLPKARRDPIAAISLSGQMHGSVFLDRHGKVLRPALLWNDQRTAPQCRQIEQLAGGRDALIQMVSNPALTGFTAPKILWLRDTEPKRFARLATVLLPKDYIAFRLTGTYATEVSDASGTLLLDVKNRRWHLGLLERLNLDPALLPPVHESPTVIGQLTTQAAKALGGLRPGIPVVAGAGDQAAGAVGTGVVEPGLLSASMGTSGVIFAAADSPATDPRGRIHTMCHALPNTWCLFGCMLSAGGSLQWLRNAFFMNSPAARKDPGSAYPQMLQLAQSVPPGAAGLLFAPYLTGERCPHPDPLARGAFVGLTPDHRLPHFVRAVVEGITFGMREQVAIMRELDIPIRQIRASGGGARSPFWRQLQSDMYNAPLVTIDVAEGAALGAAILAAAGTNAYPSIPAACRHILHLRDRHRPRPAIAKLYNTLYPRFAALYPALAPTFLPTA